MRTGESPGLRYGTPWRALVVLATAGYGLVAFVPWAVGASGTRFATVPYHGLVLVVALGLLAWRWGTGRGLRLDLPLALLLVFVVLYTARLAADTVVDPTPTRLPPEEYWLDWIGTCVIPGLAVLTVVSRETLVETGRTLTRVFLAVLILAFLYRALAAPVPAEEGLRRGGPALSGIWFGHFGASLYLLALAGMYASAREAGDASLLRDWALRGLLAFVGLAAIVASRSRGPAIAAAAGTVFLAAGGGWTWPSVKATAVVVLTGATLGGLVLATGLADPFLRRIELMDAVVGYGRFELYEIAWEKFMAHPLTGGGMEFSLAVPDNQYPHNILIEAFMATGILGGSALTVALAIYLVRSRRIAARDAGLAWVGALFVQYLVASMFSGAVYTSGYTAIMLAAAITAERVVARGEGGDRETSAEEAGAAARLSRRGAPAP